MQVFSTPNAGAYLALALLIVGWLQYQLLSRYYHAGLNRYPGPLLARFTNLWRVLDVCRDHHHTSLQQLHQKYGPAVRTGSNSLSIASSRYISVIYGVSGGFLKSAFYDPFSPRVKGKPLTSLLSERNERDYGAMRKPIAGAYSLGTLFAYEPLVDDMIARFMFELGRISKGSGKCDLTSWIRFFTWDVILNLTFGSNLGFLEKGGDVGNLMGTLDTRIDEIAWMTQMPWTSNVWTHNKIIGLFKPQSSILTTFTQKHIGEHLKRRSSPEESQSNSASNRPVDFVDRFIAAAPSSNPPGVDVGLVVNWALGNFTAGGDTTAIALCAIIYFVLKHDDVHQKLLAELRQYESRDNDPRLPVSWKESQKMPYLDVVIKESLRMHPSIGFGLERTVPASGLNMPDGYTVPAGVNVSINAWLANRDREVFGDDADSFKPDRWLQNEDEDEGTYVARIKEMKRANFTFGGGTRSCLGRNIAMLEIYKTIPTLLLQFDIELEDKSIEWKTRNRWMVRQTGINCVLKSRLKGE